MSYSLLSDNGMLQTFSFLINDFMELFKSVPAYFWLFFLFIFANTEIYVK